MSNVPLVFHRPELARKLARQILAVNIGSAHGSGVFLAAPRRTGKSTFLREDLRPEFEAAGAIVVYADRWVNSTADPGSVIVSAIRAALASTDGVLLRLAKGAGLSKVSIAGAMNFDLGRIGLGAEVSLTEALVALSDETARMVVLIIDEAQHATSSDSGVAALFGLKAARDELNSSQHHGLRIICTGSNRDKLAMLRNSRDQAFFGAPMISFPTLGPDFIDWFCQHVDLPFKLDPGLVWPLFVEAGYRPELLASAADVFRFDFDMDAAAGPDKFGAEVRKLAEEMNAVQRKVIHSLTPIQFAVLRVMAASGNDYAPFEAATMSKYRDAMQIAGLVAEEARVDVPAVQQALIALQEKKLVWRAARGVYAVEEQGVIDLLLADGMAGGSGEG